ncbi:MAG: PA2169 family four-helix-bundle protein [Sphingomonadales bacterium]|nr:MAG: PA2169 family four-helix-bundle protein [Sphingomonadales bacterium]
MSETSHDISTLNELIATTFDSIDGYTEAAKKSDNQRFVALFTARSTEREAVIRTLRAEVVRLGGKPEEDGTVLAGAHRMFINLKSVVTGRDDKAIIAEVEQGEDHIKAKFEDAIADGELSPQVMHTIRECFVSIKQGHDEMRDLKLSMT